MSTSEPWTRGHTLATASFCAAMFFGTFGVLNVVLSPEQKAAIPKWIVAMTDWIPLAMPFVSSVLALLAYHHTKKANDRVQAVEVTLARVTQSLETTQNQLTNAEAPERSYEEDLFRALEVHLVSFSVSEKGGTRLSISVRNQSRRHSVTVEDIKVRFSFAQKMHETNKYAGHLPSVLAPQCHAYWYEVSADTEPIKQEFASIENISVQLKIKGEWRPVSIGFLGFQKVTG